MLLLGTAIPQKNLQALERDIRARIAQWNDDPRPFVWTKTADETLERLAAYLDHSWRSTLGRRVGPQAA